MSKHPAILAAVAGVLAMTARSVSGATPERPNIIVVMADDMGYSDVGCYGSEIRTPTIDGLAKEGLRFSQFYNCALCGPSRASLMSGLYPYQAGVMHWTGPLNNRCVTVFELLKEAGYSTCAVGRLDMVTAENWRDPARVAECTDRFLGVASGGPGNYYRAGKDSRSPWFKDGKMYDRPVGAYSTDLISDFVVDFIEGSAGNDKPFFIYVSHFAPHWPLQAEEEDIAPYRDLYKKTNRKALMHARLKRLVDSGLIPEGTTLHDSMLNATDESTTPVEERMAIHAAMVESIDRSLADTMAALEKCGKRNNTLILVFSDNGADYQMGYNRPVPAGVRPGSMDTFINHGAAVASLNNTPFRKYKRSNFEGGIASPLVAWWPRGLKNTGRITHVPCHIADIMPTCLELSGATYPSQFRGRKLLPLVGKSLVPILKHTGKETPRTLVWSRAVRDGDWKLILHGKHELLYNISQDRNEKKHVASEFPDRVRKMKEIHAKTFSPR